MVDFHEYENLKDSLINAYYSHNHLQRIMISYLLFVFFLWFWITYKVVGRKLTAFLLVIVFVPLGYLSSIFNAPLVYVMTLILAMGVIWRSLCNTPSLYKYVVYLGIILTAICVYSSFGNVDNSMFQIADFGPLSLASQWGYDYQLFRFVNILTYTMYYSVIWIVATSVIIKVYLWCIHLPKWMNLKDAWKEIKKLELL